MKTHGGNDMPQFRTEDMNLSDGLTPHISVETAIRLLAWHVEQLVKDDEARAELRQIRKDMELCQMHKGLKEEAEAEAEAEE